MQINTRNGLILFILCVLAGGAAGVAVTPLAYTSTAIVQIVDSQETMDSFFQKNFIDLLSQRALRLVIVKAGLYENELKEYPLEDMVDQMRLNLSIWPAPNAKNSFSISLVNDNALKTQRAVNDLTQAILDSTKHDDGTMALRLLRPADLTGPALSNRTPLLAGLFGGLIAGLTMILLLRPRRLLVIRQG